MACASKTYSNVVDPDHIHVVQSDGVTSPDVLGVDISNGDVSGRRILLS